MCIFVACCSNSGFEMGVKHLLASEMRSKQLSQFPCLGLCPFIYMDDFSLSTNLIVQIPSALSSKNASLVLI